MYIKSLKLPRISATSPGRIVCVRSGGQPDLRQKAGQGKTNLLEAAAACSTMRLFRTAQKKKEGLRFGENHAFIFCGFLSRAEARYFA